MEEVARIYAQSKNHNLVIEIDKRQYNSGTELKPALHGKLVKLTDQLRAWLGIKDVIATPSVLPSASNAGKTSIPDALMSTESTELTPLQLISLPLKLKVPDPAKDKPAPKPLSIVAQIDVVLQEMLEHSPLKSQGIRLSENPYHGVIVWIQGNHYEGIENIPDPEIKELIRKAVSRWEQQAESRNSYP